MIFDELWRLERKRDKLNRYANAQIALHNQKDSTQMEYDNFSLPTWMLACHLDDEIAYARSLRLIRKADRLGIPIPKTDNEAWSTRFGKKFGRRLSDKAYSDLKTAIKQERKERREAATAIIKDVITLLGALIVSILSLLIAYAALKLRH